MKQTPPGFHSLFNSPLPTSKTQLTTEPFYPAYPATNAKLESATLREQFNSLKILFDALAVRVGEFEAQNLAQQQHIEALSGQLSSTTAIAGDAQTRVTSVEAAVPLRAFSPSSLSPIIDPYIDTNGLAGRYNKLLDRLVNGPPI